MKVLKINEHTTAEMPDHVVVSKILSGEKEWFELLMRRYNQSLYRVVRSYFKEEAEVEDAMQEAYIKAFQKLDQFRGEASFGTWLIRVGINEALQRIRKRKRQPNDSGNAIELNEKVSHLFPHNMDPEKKAIQAETRWMIESAIDKLPEKYRVVYMLKEVEGMKNIEISATLNISESNVKVRAHRAKTLLKEHLLKMSSTVNIFEFGYSRCDKLVAVVMSRI